MNFDDRKTRWWKYTDKARRYLEEVDLWLEAAADSAGRAGLTNVQAHLAAMRQELQTVDARFTDVMAAAGVSISNAGTPAAPEPVDDGRTVVVNADLNVQARAALKDWWAHVEVCDACRTWPNLEAAPACAIGRAIFVKFTQLAAKVLDYGFGEGLVKRQENHT